MSTTKDWSQVIKDAGDDATSGLKVTLVGTEISIPTTAGALDIKDFQDTPVLNASSTNIPASASDPLQIVATLAANIAKIHVNDTTGEFIGVYTGAALSEVLQCIVGPGTDGDIEVDMDSGQRVSVRNMANSTIAVGNLCIQFLG